MQVWSQVKVNKEGDLYDKEAGVVVAEKDGVSSVKMDTTGKVFEYSDAELILLGR